MIDKAPAIGDHVLQRYQKNARPRVVLAVDPHLNLIVYDFDLKSVRIVHRWSHDVIAERDSIITFNAPTALQVYRDELLKWWLGTQFSG